MSVTILSLVGIAFLIFNSDDPLAKSALSLKQHI